MSKPNAYFSIQQHTFDVKGRKENKGKNIEKTEFALYLQGQVFEISYKALGGKAAKIRYIKSDGLEKISGIAKLGYSEEITEALLKNTVSTALWQVLNDKKVSTLGFCNWVTEELAKIPKVVKPKGRVPGSGAQKVTVTVPKEVRETASLLASLAPLLSPEELVSRLKEVAGNEELLSKAVALLQEALKKNGRVTSEFLSLRMKNGSGFHRVNNPQFGYIRLRNRTK